MLKLIAHLLQTNLKEILAHSYMNNYSMGVHKISLFISEELTINIFYADECSQLHNKTYSQPITNNNSVKTIEVLSGVLSLSTYRIASGKTRGSETYKEYDFYPDKFSHTLLNPVNELIKEAELQYYPNYFISLDTGKYYNLRCKTGAASWIEYVGPEINHSGPKHCFAIVDPNINFNNKDLYRPMTERDLRYILKKIYPKTFL